MAKYLSGRQKNLKIGISSYTENQTVLQIIGKVGIGTSSASSGLDVFGGLRIRDQLVDSYGNVGYANSVLVSIGTGVVWSQNLSVTVASGQNTQIQYNDNGQFGGANLFVYDSINTRVGIGTSIPGYLLDVRGEAKIHTLIDRTNSYGPSSYVPVADGTGNWNWAPVTAAGAATTGYITVKENGVPVGSPGGISELNFADNIVATGLGNSASISVNFPGSNNQILYKDSNNVATGSPNLTFDGTNLYVGGNVTIGGTTVSIAASILNVNDKDIVLGLATNGNGNVISNDITATHGGIAVASTEGSPLISLGYGNTNNDLPDTYKQIMWIKSGYFAGLNTDAWIFNYAVGVGSTQIPNGVRLAAGGMQVTDTTVSSPILDGTVSSKAITGQISTSVVDSGDLLLVYNNATSKIYKTSIQTAALQGLQGLQGNQGIQGLIGSQGTQGLQGLQGFQGLQGSQGLQGLQGTQGLQGLQGLQGTQGTQGLIGSQGTEGLQGLQGLQGNQGTQGLQGLQGNQGTQGLIGSQGTQGLQGLQGLQGTQGAQGLQGLTGPVAGSANQIVYKDSTNNPTGSNNLIFNGTNLLVGTASSTGVDNQLIQIAGQAYISSNVGIGTTNAIYSLTVTNTGTPALTGLTNCIADVSSNVNSYAQINIRNASNGASASGDLILTADTGNDTTNFIDLGINNSGYSSPNWTINGSLDGYLYANNGNLSIGAASNKYVSFFVGGTLSSNEAARFDSNKNLLIGSTSSTGTSNQILQVNGGTYVAGNIGIGSTVPTSPLYVVGDTYVTGILTASRIISSVYGEFTGGSISGSNIVGSALSISGISTFTSGPVLIGSNTLTGTSSQPLQITGGAYVSGNLGVGTTNPQTSLQVGAAVSIYGGTGIISATRYYGDGSTLSGVLSVFSISANNTNQYQYLTYGNSFGNVTGLGVTSGLVFNPSIGYLGIGSAIPSQALDVFGNINASGTITANSDIKLKKNITTISNALQKVLNLRGVEYDRTDIDEHQIGVIAQEVEEIIPELVKDNNGTKAVAYGNFIALLIEAIKEQNKRINLLENKLKDF